MYKGRPGFLWGTRRRLQGSRHPIIGLGTSYSQLRPIRAQHSGEETREPIRGQGKLRIGKGGGPSSLGNLGAD